MLSSCPSHVSSDFTAGRSFDKQGLYSVKQVSPSEKAVDWINIVTLHLMSLRKRWNLFEDTRCQQLFVICGSVFYCGVIFLS